MHYIDDIHHYIHDYQRENIEYHEDQRVACSGIRDPTPEKPN